MSRRGFLPLPDPARTDVCARPGCAHIEGEHLICGCGGGRCDCPGFLAELAVCPDCGGRFGDASFAAHCAHRPGYCRQAEQASAERAQRREKVAR